MDSAQISTEFFILLGLAFIMAIAFGLVSVNQLKDFRVQKESEAVKDIGLKLQRELVLAAGVEDGYVRIFEIPDKIENSINYSLTIQNSTITVKSKNSLYITSIPKVIGNLSRGINKINKTEGVIYLNNIRPFVFTNLNTCQNAQNDGLCAGLDVAYGVGYQAACCSEHGLCC